MRLLERHEMVDVQLPGVAVDLARIAPIPKPSDHIATVRGFHDGLEALGQEDFVVGVDAVSVAIEPVRPVVAVVPTAMFWRDTEPHQRRTHVTPIDGFAGSRHSVRFALALC